MAIRHEIILSTTEPNNETGLIKVRQADEATQKLIVQISENGARKPYAGLQAFFCGKIGQSDGLGIIEQKLTEEEMTDPEIGRLEYTFRAEDWQKVGRQIGYFSFRKMVDEHTFEEQFTTRDFYYVVTKSIFSEGVREARNDGSTYIWTIEDMLRLFKEYIASGKSDWEEFVEQNKDIIEAVDPGGKVLTELVAARKPDDKEPFSTLGQRLNAIDLFNTTVHDRVESLNQRFKGHVNTDSAITNLLNIGLTYTEQPKIRYGQQGTAASAENTGKLHDDGFYYMDCSSFVEIVLRGVEYQNSAYQNDGINYPTSEGFYFDPSFEHLYDRFLANEQAKYCLENGWAFKANDDFSNVMPGDIIFITGATDSDYFLNIEHVGFVLNKDQNQNLTILEMGNANDKKVEDFGAQISTYGRGWLNDRCALIGRIPLKDINQENGAINLSKTTSLENTYDVITELKQKKVYTVIFEADINSGYVALGENISNLYYSFLPHVTRLPNKKYKAIFTIPTSQSVFKKRLAFYGLGGADNIIVNNAELFEGVVTSYDVISTKQSVALDNSKGTVFKLDSGVMICTNIIKDVGPNKTQSGNLWVSDTITWEFPESFYDGNVVVSVDCTITNRWATITSTPTITSVNFQTISAVEHNTLSNCFITAIGRWK